MGGKNSKKPDLNMSTCGIYDVDQMFAAIADPLKNLNNTTKRLTRALKDFKRATGTHVLKRSEFKDSIIGMLYAYSAGSNGDFSKIGLKFLSSKPYLEVNRDSIRVEHRPISNTWDRVLAQLEETPEQLKELKGQIENFSEEAKEFPTKLKETNERQKLSLKQKFKAGRVIAKNSKRLSRSNIVIERTQRCLQEAQDALNEVIKLSAPDELAKIHEIGNNAHSQDVFNPLDIIVKFWPQKSRVSLKLNKPQKNKAEKNKAGEEHKAVEEHKTGEEKKSH